jgi:hypothetical protein
MPGVVLGDAGHEQEAMSDRIQAKSRASLRRTELYVERPFSGLLSFLCQNRPHS